MERGVLGLGAQFDLEGLDRLGGRVAPIGLGVVALDHRCECVPVDRGVRAHSAVERRGSRDRIGALTREHQREAPTHAEPGGTHLGATGPLGEQVDRTTQVLAGGGEVHAHHQLARRVGLGGGFAVVQVGGECGEPLRCEPVGDVLDVVDETPPFLDHDHPGPTTVGKVSRAHPAIALECDHLAHRNRTSADSRSAVGTGR